MKTTDPCGAIAMDRIRYRYGRGAALGLALLASLALIRPASAQLIAGDAFNTVTSNPDPSQGQYLNGASIKGQSGLTTTGFNMSGYSSALAGTTLSSNFTTNSGGLTYTNPNNGASGSSPGPNPGEVTWIGANDDNTIRDVSRSIAPTSLLSTLPTTGGTAWFNIMISQDGLAAQANGFALAGFGNSVVPTTGSTTGTLQGLYFGFAQDDGSNDLVMRTRVTATTTTSDTILQGGLSGNTAQVYDVVAQLNYNVIGTPNNAVDSVTLWVDPTDFSGVAGLNNTAIYSTTVSTYALQLPVDLTDASMLSQNWTGVAKFSDLMMGETLADVAPAINPSTVPEPASVALVALGLAGTGLGAAIRRRRARG